MNYFHNHIYPRMPVFLQNMAISAFGFTWRNRRLGGFFQRERKAFKAREMFTFDQWSSYQEEELRKLLIHAYTTVPYYQTTYSKLGIELGDLRQFKLNQLPELPVLEKETLRNFGETDLLSSSKQPGRKFFTSSGSTGTPVNILFSSSAQQKWYAAYEARCRNWAGVDYRSSRAMIGGRKIVFGNPGKPPFHRVNFAENQIYFSIVHLSSDNFKWYYKALQQERPVYLTGYSTSIYLLARYLLDLNFTPIKLRAVIGSSEKLTDQMKKVIAEAFLCPVYDSWSGIEACGLISENQDGNLYVSPDTGIIEFTDSNFKKVEYGEEGEMICTGLINYDQPLIRYRIGDLAIPLKPLEGEKDIKMPRVKEIVGRVDDIITLKDGRQLSSFNRFFADIDGIKEAQVVQIDLDKFQINLVADTSQNSRIKEEIVTSLQSRLGNIHIDIVELSEIKRMPNGKFKAVISNVKR